MRFATKCWKTGDLAQSLEDTVENRKFSRCIQKYQIKASHRFLGIVCPAMLSMGAEIDQRVWATNRAWKELYGMWWDKRASIRIKRTLFRGAVYGTSLTGLTALLLHDRDYLRFPEMLGEKAPRSHARHGFMGRTRPHKHPQFSTSVGKVAIGAPCLRIVRAETQLVPEHRQRTCKARTSPMLFVGTNALRNARYAHRW